MFNVVTLILANVIAGWSNSTSKTLNTPANQGLSGTEIKCGSLKVALILTKAP